jgi:hypothetical protein
MCPVKALWDYLQIRGHETKKEQPLFSLMNKNINLILPRAREFRCGGIVPVTSLIRRNAWQANKYIAFSIADVNFFDNVYCSLF